LDGTMAEERPTYVFLTHDIDWPIHGPGVNHVMARRERFSKEVIEKALKYKYNPYFNIPEIMDIEDSYGIRSTFFFRPIYDDGTTVDCYSQVIQDLRAGRWEVAVHLNRADQLDAIVREKGMIEEVLGAETLGARVHYLRIRPEDLSLLREAGFLYDSSLCFAKDRISGENMGFLRMFGLLEFPITLMDAYMFSYMGVREEEVLPTVERALELARGLGKEVVTILWHDASLQMVGGRRYRDVVEYLSSLDWVSVVRGVDLIEKISEGGARR